MVKIFKNELIWLSLIVILSFWVRLYKLDNPIADWHSWRQADTASVARNFFKKGWNPLYPKFDDMSAVSEKPKFNPQGFRYVEFPIYNTLVYFTYLLNGRVDETFARLVNVIISLGSIILLYLITKRYTDQLTAIVAAFLFGVLPFNIYFSRAILPEPILVFFCLGMFYFTELWINQNSLRLFLMSVIFTACAFLTKPMAIFYLLPLGYSFYKKEQKWWPVPRRYLIWAIVSFLPLLGWRIWINRHPEGIPASNWLLNGNKIRFRPAFFRWIIGDRFGREILGASGTFLFFLGAILKPRIKEQPLLHLLAFSSLLYLITFATGNVQHDYYQVLIVPVLVIFVARGFTSLVRGDMMLIPRIFTIPLAVLFLLLVPYLTWFEVKGLYQINNGVIVEAGRTANKILPQDAVVVAPYNGDTAFLYQINRRGFPSVPLPTKDLIDRFGATHYISVNFDSKTKWVIRKYRVILKTSKYVIVNLQYMNPGFVDALDPEPME